MAIHWIRRDGNYPSSLIVDLGVLNPLLALCVINKYVVCPLSQVNITYSQRLHMICYDI